MLVGVLWDGLTLFGCASLTAVDPLRPISGNYYGFLIRAGLY